jgi:hypothetical protein
VSLGGKRSLIDVICTEFIEEDGTPVVERVVKARLRPLPPSAADPPLAAYAAGDRVDVRSNDCWWEATVTAPAGDAEGVEVRVNGASGQRAARWAGAVWRRASTAVRNLHAAALLYP